MKKIILALLLSLIIVLSGCDTQITPNITDPTTESPTQIPTENPTNETPTEQSPTEKPAENPTEEAPTQSPTNESSTSAPTENPNNNSSTGAPTEKPTDESPTSSPTEEPTNDSSTSAPTENPTNKPTEKPTEKPTDAPTLPDYNDSCAHSDFDNNGLCDICEISVIVTIDFYAINDLHGKFGNTASNIGVDELTTFLKNSYQTDDHSITLSSGDMWQGGSESNLTKGLIITEWLNYIDAVSMTLGNHEFDWGEEFIANNLAIAEFPFLAINIYDRDTNSLSDYCAPSVVVERGGVQIGIIGAVGDCYSSIAPDHSGGIYFKVGDQLTELVKAESNRLRAQGVDYIVYSIHDGYEQNVSGTTSVSASQISSYYDIELSEGGYVDLVFEGHTHKNYVLRDTYGVYHLQNGGDNRGISHVEININIANSSSSVNTARFVESSVYASLADDSIVEVLRDKYADQIAVGDAVIGYNSSYKNSSYLCQTAANLYFQKGLELWGDEYDIVLGGGFFQARSPYNLYAGNVKYSDLQSIFPFDNHLVLCSIKGSDLLSKFINTSNSNYYVAYESGLASKIVASKTYYIVVDSYTSTYAPNRLTEIMRWDADVFARDLLADYIADGKFS